MESIRKRRTSGRRGDQHGLEWSIKEAADLIEVYGALFNETDLKREEYVPVRPSAGERASSPELVALAKRHKPAECVAILTTRSGVEPYKGVSKDRSKSDINRNLVNKLDQHNLKHTFGCAEIDCLDQAYATEYKEGVNESPVKGAGVEAAHANELRGAHKVGDPYPPCPRCGPVLRHLDIIVTNA